MHDYKMTDRIVTLSGEKLEHNQYKCIKMNAKSKNIW